MLTLFGIKNCDSVKKARHWLEEHQIEYRFHDFRTEGLTAERLQQWNGAVGWEALLNRRGTSWRQLPQEVKEAIDEPSALAMILENPTLIKRPVLELNDGTVHVNFKADDYARLLNL
ncbi:MAG: ArsC family reductase [Gammaproteobacteria bacterium]|nr:ArsC family reductase [Gammaproteobacteria bacterium]